MKSRNRISWLMVLVAALSLSGCLKTRAQLKSDSNGDEGAQPSAQAVRDVRPQGGYAIDELKQEITRITGRIEDLERRPTVTDDPKADSAREETIKRLEGRITELEQAQLNMLDALKKMQANVPPPSTGDLMEKARGEIRAKNYEAAIESLNSVLKSPKSKDAEEAAFLRGDAYFEMKQYKKAILDYSKFPEKYGKSKRMPAALYRIGQSFEALGMKEDAKGFYSEVVEKYPTSPEGKRSRSKTKLR